MRCKWAKLAENAGYKSISQSINGIAQFTEYWFEKPLLAQRWLFSF
jgi:hypothetical protein